MRTERRYCTDSTCLTTDDCAEDFACRTLRSSSGKDLLRTCSLEGLRQEGEMCEEHPAKREDGCQKGLICHGFCGRPCRLDKTTSCADGYVCKDGDNGASCQPSCEGRACPPGQRCVTTLLGGIGSVCMKVHGQDCEINPCSQGLSCSRTTFTTEPGKLWMECLKMCSKGCAEDEACSLFQCRPACDPDGPSVCEPGFACLRNYPGQPWACMPDSRAP